MKKNLLSFSFLILASAAHAGTRAGDGGHVALCYDRPTADPKKVELLKPLSIELLDFYESKRRPKLTIRNPDGSTKANIALGAADLPTYAKVQIAIDRLRRLDPSRATVYQAELNRFEAQAVYLPQPDPRYFKSDDAGSTMLDYNCLTRQAVAQNLDRSVPADAYYLIDNQYWNALSSDHKAGLVLHEIVYREAIQRGHSDSVLVRYFTALLASDLLNTMTAEDYYSEVIASQMIGIVGSADNKADVEHFWYFPELVSREEAEAFCGQLAKHSLSNWQLVTQANSANKTWFVRKMMRESSDGYTEPVWLRGKSIETSAMAISYGDDENKVLDITDDTKLGTICTYQEPSL